MKKLKLDVHALRVDSFESGAEREPELGTVHGNDATSLCSGQASCQVTVCQATCYCPYTSLASCWGNCPTANPATCP